MFTKFIPVLGALAVATSASAHVSFEQSEVAIGQTIKFTLRVPHGCSGEATQKVRIEIPEGLVGVKPMPKAGWDLVTTSGAYARSYDTGHAQVSEGVKEIVWTGDLPDAFYDEFSFRGTVTDAFKPGSTLYVPVVQDCAKGQAAWTEIAAEGQDPHSLKAPAPGIRIADAMGEQEHHAMPESWTVGDLTITGPFSRATLPNAPVAGGFLTVTNNGHHDDRLIGATSEAASRMELHEMAMQGDVMKMRELKDGLPIPAGETVELKPGGFHIMFMQLKHPFREGETVMVTLTFEKAGSVEVPLMIGAPNAKGQMHQHKMGN